jgi:hypothetical protein
VSTTYWSGKKQKGNETLGSPSHLVLDFPLQPSFQHPIKCLSFFLSLRLKLKKFKEHMMAMYVEIKLRGKFKIIFLEDNKKGMDIVLRL